MLITKYRSLTQAPDNPTKESPGTIHHGAIVLGVWSGGFHVERHTELLE